jgi:acyl-CoA thioester hydrolase
MRYAVASHRHGRVAAEGTGRIVSYDYEKQCKTPLQTELRDRLSRLESGA